MAGISGHFNYFKKMKNLKALNVFIIFCFIFINEIFAQHIPVRKTDLWSRVKMINPVSVITKQPIIGGKNTIFVFLSPECPLSRNYIPELNRIKNVYKSFELIGVFPGKSYSLKEVKAFIKEYKLTFTSVIDEKKLLTNLLNGTVTPEVVLVDNKGTIAYSGLVDDKIIELGQQRQVASKHFLTDAIEALETNKKITVSNTKPIGCYINDL